MADDDVVGQITEAIRAQNQGALESTAALVRTLDRIATRVDDVDRRLMRVEASTMDRDLRRLDEELDKLTASVERLSTWQAHMTGAMGLFNWVRSSWPLFAAIGVGLLAWLDFRLRR